MHDSQRCSINTSTHGNDYQKRKRRLRYSDQYEAGPGLGGKVSGKRISSNQTSVTAVVAVSPKERSETRVKRTFCS